MRVLEQDTTNQILRGTRLKRTKKNKLIKNFINCVVYAFIIGILFVFFLMYGPYNKFREWYITTAMTTMSHQYLATYFYNSNTINDVLNKNKIEELNLITDPTLITTMSTTANVTYTNEYEKEIFQKDMSHPDYKIIKLKGKTYSGYLAVIYDPSKVSTLVTSDIGKEGQYLTDMANENNATIAVNGGVFTGLSTSTEEINRQEKKYGGSGGSPMGITISNGKVISNTNYNGVGGLIGFNKDNKLILGKMTLKKAQSLNIRDAVTCGPFLIINGQASKIVGNGGWGTAPRTAIGQRADGIILMVVIDGRRATIPGATMEDLLKIMQNYGAYNASALDGGTSTAMVENGKLVNDPIDSTGAHNTRPIASGFGAIFK